jgi:hypothetical protein
MERDQERNIISMKTRGNIPTAGVTLFPMISKGEKKKDHEINIRSTKTRGELPREDTLFHSFQKGREKMRDKDEEQWS